MTTSQVCSHVGATHGHGNCTGDPAGYVRFTPTKADIGRLTWNVRLGLTAQAVLLETSNCSQNFLIAMSARQKADIRRCRTMSVFGIVRIFKMRSILR
jgi:hypothetical protein